MKYCITIHTVGKDFKIHGDVIERSADKDAMTISDKSGVVIAYFRLSAIIGYTKRILK